MRVRLSRQTQLSGTDQPYDFMIEYDADSEDSDEELYDGPEANRQKEKLDKDLSDDDDESSGPPELIELTPSYIPTESDSDSDILKVHLAWLTYRLDTARPQMVRTQMSHQIRIVMTIPTLKDHQD